MASSAVLTLSTRRQHQPPLVKGSVPQNYACLTSHADCKSTVSPVFLPDQLWIRSSMTPFSGLINSQNSEKAFLYEITTFFIKGYNSGAPTWRTCIGPGVWKGHGASGHSPQISTGHDPGSSVLHPRGVLRRLRYVGIGG